MMKTEDWLKIYEEDIEDCNEHIATLGKLIRIMKKGNEDVKQWENFRRFWYKYRARARKNAAECRAQLAAATE